VGHRQPADARADDDRLAWPQHTLRFKRSLQASTRERLIDAAVRLFGEHGVGATSPRMLTETAGTNIAAVNYHFGSKEGLLRAVVDHTMHAVNDQRRRSLDELEAASQPPIHG
jgi:AcrR family transcriptional regulator